MSDVIQLFYYNVICNVFEITAVRMYFLAVINSQLTGFIVFRFCNNKDTIGALKSIPLIHSK